MIIQFQEAGISHNETVKMVWSFTHRFSLIPFKLLILLRLVPKLEVSLWIVKLVADNAVLGGVQALRTSFDNCRYVE